MGASIVLLSSLGAEAGGVACRSNRSKLRLDGTMPQPISNATALGTMAPFIEINCADRAALPGWASGIAARCGPTIGRLAASRSCLERAGIELDAIRKDRDATWLLEAARIAYGVVR
jgi:hypothetical protein